jgi:TonB family protein
MADLFVPAAFTPALAPADMRPARPPAPRRWLEIGAAISAIVHGLVLAIYIFAPAAPPPPAPPAPPPPPAGFEMVFQGGVRSPDAVPAPGKYISVPDGDIAPAPPDTKMPQADRSPPQATPAPEVNLLPPELQMLAPPEPQPDQQAAQQPTKTDRRRPARTRTAPHTTPFPRPQQYTLSTRPSPAAPQGLRGSKSMDLELGREVRGGVLDNGAFHVSTPGADGDYLELIHQYVETHKYYPDQAIAEGQDGIAVIHATISPQGRILHLELVESSGSSWLDMAWLGLFRSMDLPRFPPDMKVPQLDFTYSMDYHLIRR